MTPSGATPVNGIGVVSYQLRLPPVDGSGPGMEIGWLSAAHRIIVLRFVFAAGATDAEVTAFLTKLIAFANLTDATLATAGFVGLPSAPPASGSSPAAP